jgi:hypothetical protein
MCRCLDALHVFPGKFRARFTRLRRFFSLALSSGFMLFASGITPNKDLRVLPSRSPDKNI